MRSRFDLSQYAGRRIRVRWIGASWVFSLAASSYFEYGQGWDGVGQDDGWWLDDIRITGVVESQASLTADPSPGAGGTCPGAACDPSVGDGGTAVVLEATDLDGVPLEGVSAVAVPGQTVRLSASQSTLPGGCVNGSAEFLFERDADLLQNWSPSVAAYDVLISDTLYAASARCSTDPACTSRVGAGVQVLVYPGDGTDIALSAVHDRLSATTTVSWPSRPQIVGVSGYDLYAGVIAFAGDPAVRDLTGLSCLEGDIPQPAGAPGPTVAVSEVGTPASGQIVFYLAGHSPTTSGETGALGIRSDLTARPRPPPCP